MRLYYMNYSFYKLHETNRKKLKKIYLLKDF